MNLVIVIPMIHRAPKSNGIKVLLELALEVQRKGVDIKVFPTLTSHYIPLGQIGESYRSLPITRHIPEGSVVIIPDSVNPYDVDLIRIKTRKIVWYSLAVPGMFSSIGMPYVERMSQEKEIVYSPQVSQLFPSFYFQPKYVEIEDCIEAVKSSGLATRGLRQRNRFKLALYQGKGALCSPYPDKIRRLIKRSETVRITRDYPADKHTLISLLVSCDGLISLDALSSLNHEATLIGLPVYLHNKWDIDNFMESFPVDLSGICHNDPKKFEYLLKNGFNSEASIRSYRRALHGNSMVAERLIVYCREVNKNVDLKDEYNGLKECELINRYWKSRNPTHQDFSVVYSHEYISSGGQLSADIFRLAAKRAALGVLRVPTFPLRMARLLYRYMRNIVLRMSMY